MSELYQLSSIRLKEEVGTAFWNDDETGEVQRFLRWHLGTESVELASLDRRMAPSIIVRNEAGLLGSSMPRFAVRIYLSKQRNTGFINVRRTPLLKKCLESRSDLTPDQLQRVTSELRKTKPIADSLVSPPPSLRAKYKIVTARIASEYGEPFDYEAVPFVQNTWLQGGLCGQASLFMLLGLCPGGRLMGVADLSAKAHLANAEHVVQPHVFRVLHMLHCILETKLSAFAQYSSKGEATDRYSRLAWKSYLRSSIPLILLVSEGCLLGIHEDCAHLPPVIRMKDRPDWSDRSHFPKKQNAEIKNPGTGLDAHAIVLVGVDQKGDSFLINDPNFGPFFEATASQLLTAIEKRKSSDAQAGDGHQSVVALPPSVTTPLLPYEGTSVLAFQADKKRVRSFGHAGFLIKVREWLTTQLSSEAFFQSSFTLCQFRDGRFQKWDDTQFEVAEFSNWKDPLGASRWYWLQQASGDDGNARVWLWRADLDDRLDAFCDPDQWLAATFPAS